MWDRCVSINEEDLSVDRTGCSGKNIKDALNNFYTVVKAELLSFSFSQPFSKSRLTCRIPFDKSS